DIGVLDEAPQHLEPFRLFQIERDAALVAVEVLEIGSVPRAAQPAIAFGGFDLDDFGTPIRELADGGRAGAHAGEIDDLEAGQRKLAHGSSVISSGGRKPRGDGNVEMTW